MRPPHVSTGERVICCTKADCAHTGDEVMGTTAVDLAVPGTTYFICLADIVILDRRERFRKTCGAYAKRTT